MSIELAPVLISVGAAVLLRSQNQTLMDDVVRSMAYQPPPMVLNAGPKLSAVGACTPQPSLPSVLTSQLFPVAAPSMVRCVGMLHVDPTCKVIALGERLFTPSILQSTDKRPKMVDVIRSHLLRAEKKE